MRLPIVFEPRLYLFLSGTSIITYLLCSKKKELSQDITLLFTATICLTWTIKAHVSRHAHSRAIYVVALTQWKMKTCHIPVSAWGSSLPPKGIAHRPHQRFPRHHVSLGPLSPSSVLLLHSPPPPTSPPPSPFPIRTALLRNLCSPSTGIYAAPPLPLLQRTGIGSS
jgi:hypothetical protein